MRLDKVFFAVFIILSLTLNFGFYIGELDNPKHHLVFELFLAVGVNIIALILKFGDDTHIGSTQLAASVVAVLQLVGASAVWGWTTYSGTTMTIDDTMPTILSLSAGALVANIVSVVLLIIETSILSKK
jgi:hypothetical protein